MTDNPAKTDGPTIRTETMAQLLLSQGHWRQARQIYQGIYAQDPEKYSHIEEILADIDREYMVEEPKIPDQTMIIKSQIDYLHKFLQQIGEES